MPHAAILHLRGLHDGHHPGRVASAHALDVGPGADRHDFVAADMKPPFDTLKWSFFLVAAVIATHCVVVLASVAFCWSHPEFTERCGGLRGQLIEMMAGALAAALAFAGGFARGKGGDDKEK